MKAHLIDSHLLVPRSRSSAKVKVRYQDNVSQKMGVLGALVFHKHILFVYMPCEKLGMIWLRVNPEGRKQRFMSNLCLKQVPVDWIFIFLLSSLKCNHRQLTDGNCILFTSFLPFKPFPDDKF